MWPSPQGIGDGVGAVAQVEPGGHPVQHVLDRAFGVRELACDLRGVQTFGDQTDDVDLARRQTRQRAGPVVGAALKLSDLLEQPGEQIRG